MSKEEDMRARKIIDGQREPNWRDAMDNSGIYIALITPHFSDDLNCIEQTLHAKHLQIPTIQLWREGVELSIPDLFDGCNIVATYYWNDNNFMEIKDKLLQKITELHMGHRIRAHRGVNIEIPQDKKEIE